MYRFLLWILCRQVNPSNSYTIIANSNSSDLSLRRRVCWGFRCIVYPTTAQLFGPLKRPLCTYIASMEVNHHFGKVGSFWMIINLYFKRWWFVSQPIKHKESPWLKFQGIYKVYTKDNDSTARCWNVGWCTPRRNVSIQHCWFTWNFDWIFHIVGFTNPTNENTW